MSDFPGKTKGYPAKTLSHLCDLKDKESGKLLFPADLADLIERKNSTQVLAVSRDRICILELVTKDAVREMD